MELKIEVRDNTKPDPMPGTLAWLTANAGYVELYTTKANNVGATLYDKGGNLITFLCGTNMLPGDSDGNPDGPIRIAVRYSGSMYEEDNEEAIFAQRTFTDAAWEVIEEVQVAAAEAIRDHLDSHDEVCGGGDEVEVVTVRVKDRDAAALSRSLRDDPAVVPILRDRLAEVMP